LPLKIDLVRPTHERDSTASNTPDLYIQTRLYKISNEGGILMSSLARIAASRANGALSRGPKTAAGKARSSRNNTRHGFLSRAAPAPDPSDSGFQDLLADYVRRFGHTDPSTVEALALCQWRARLAWTMEKQWLDELMAADPTPEPAAKLAHAFAALAKTNKYRLLLRFEGRQQRLTKRLLQSLLHRPAIENAGSNLAPTPAAGQNEQPQAAPAARNDDSNLEWPPSRPACRHPRRKESIGRPQFRPATRAAAHRPRHVP
jgi:hypothetical protein